MIEPLLDTCIICGRQATKPGAGICTYHELMALIDLGYDRLRAAIRGEIPTIGKRLQPTRHAPAVSVQILTDANEDPF